MHTSFIDEEIKKYKDLSKRINSYEDIERTNGTFNVYLVHFDNVH